MPRTSAAAATPQETAGVTRAEGVDTLHHARGHSQRKPGQELPRADDADAAELSDGEHVTVTGDEVFGTAHEGGTEQTVIVGIPAHAGRLGLGQQKTVSSEEAEQRIDVVGRHSVLPGDLRATKNLCDFVDLPGRDQEDECPVTPRIDEAPLKPGRAEHAAHQLVGVQHDPTHVVAAARL